MSSDRFARRAGIGDCRTSIAPWLRPCGILPHGAGAVEIDGIPDSVAYPAPSRSEKRGGSRVVTNAGLDAVDAAASSA